MYSTMASNSNWCVWYKIVVRYASADKNHPKWTVHPDDIDELEDDYDETSDEPPTKDDYNDDLESEDEDDDLGPKLESEDKSEEESEEADDEHNEYLESEDKDDDESEEPPPKKKEPFKKKPKASADKNNPKWTVHPDDIDELKEDARIHANNMLRANVKERTMLKDHILSSPQII
jgi:hypothetical protein